MGEGDPKGVEEAAAPDFSFAARLSGVRMATDRTGKHGYCPPQSTDVSRPRTFPGHRRFKEQS